METCFGIFCLLFSAFIVPGLFIEQQESDAVMKAIEQLIQDRYIEETLRELYSTDNEEFTDVKEEEHDAGDDALLKTIRAFMNAKRLRQTGFQNIYERWDDLHGRGTDTTPSRRTTGEETTFPKSTAAATETTTTTTPSSTTTTTTPSSTTTTTTPSSTTTTTTKSSTTTTTTPSSTTTTPTTSTTTPPPPPITTNPPVPALVTEIRSTASTMSATTSSSYSCKSWGWWSWLCRRYKFNRIPTLRKIRLIQRILSDYSD